MTTIRTDWNVKQLANAYNISASALHSYLQPHREALRSLATKKVVLIRRRKTLRIQQNFNSAQLKFILENILKDTPEGYLFNGETLVKSNKP